MPPAVTAISSASLRRRYKALLRSEGSLTSLQNILALLSDEIKDGAQALPDPGDPLVVERIRYFADILRDPSLPAIPKGYTGIGNPHPSFAPLAKLTESAWTFLTLQNRAEIKGERDFLRDTQSLLFLCAVDFLLPELEKKTSLLPERAVLINAMSFHAFAAWRDNPAHQWFLSSLVMDHLQHYALRFEYLRRSFVLTPVEDHSYLTKAQALWSDLVDFEQYAEAETFLLDLFRRSPPEHLAEIRDMIHSMYAFKGTSDAK